MAESITCLDRIVADRSLAAGSTPAAESAPYTPVYARSGKARNGRKAVKTWMILAPMGAAVLIGGSVAMAIGGESSAPLGTPVPIELTPPAVPIMASPVTDGAPAVLAVPTQPGTSAEPAPAKVVRQSAATPGRTPTAPARTVAAPAVEAAEPALPPAGPRPYLSVVEPASVAPLSPSTPVLPPETVTGPPID
jgi:hypothetical protein